jgi:hypothetical protein
MFAWQSLGSHTILAALARTAQGQGRPTDDQTRLAIRTRASKDGSSAEARLELVRPTRARGA